MREKLTKKLTKKLTNNLGLKLIAAVSAILLWLLIMNTNDPQTTFTVSGIPIEFANGSVLEENGLVYDVVGNRTVSVSVTTRTKDKDKIKFSDFKATADLAEIYGLTSNVKVDVELVNNASLVRKWSQMDFGTTIATEKVVTRPFRIEVVEQGKVEDGFDYRQCTLSSGTVELTGAVSKLNDISAVKAFVDVSLSAESGTMTVPLVFYNSAGREIRSLNSLGIETEMREVEVKVVVQKTSPVSLDVVVNNKDKVAEGYRYITYRISDQSISVIGTMQAVAGLDKIQIEVDAEGASGEVVKEIDIRDYLPANVTVAGDEPLITIRLVVEPEGTKEFEVPSANVRFEGEDYSWAYYVHQPRIKVSVFGLKSDWQNLQAKDIFLTGNVAGLEVGDHVLVLTAVPIEGLEITVEEEVVLTIVDPEDEPSEDPDDKPVNSTEKVESTKENEESTKAPTEGNTESESSKETSSEDKEQETTEARNSRWFGGR